MLALTITHAFAPYSVGDTVTDEAEIEKLRAGPNHRSVVAVNLPDPKPEPEPETADAKSEGGEPDKAPAEAPGDHESDGKGGAEPDGKLMADRKPPASRADAKRT